MTAKKRSTLGKLNYEHGHEFEHKVADIYRLLHYQVDLGIIFSGRQVDLLLKKYEGDLEIYRAIECKVGQVTVDHIDIFLNKLRLVKKQYPTILGSMISAVSFTDAVKAHAAAEGIQLTLFSDLVSKLVDGRAYSTDLVRESESNEQYVLKNYIEPLVGMKSQGEGVNAFGIVETWLDDSDWNQLTLLGDVGTGKSFLSKILAYRLAKKYLEDPVGKPFPVLVDLRNADREFSLEGLVITHLTSRGLSNVSFNLFQYVLSQGKIVLILDGFDEMAARITPQVTNRNFQQLARSVTGRAKVLLTCRTHYFKSRSEEEEVILGVNDELQSETLRDLYWELVSRKGFKIGYLRPFTIPQIEEYVHKIKKDGAKQALAKIRSTYNLMELSHRPMLLEMIVKSIDKLNTADINATELYNVFTNVWIFRDKWRDTMSPETKLRFLTTLAKILWEEEESNIHHVELSRCLQQELNVEIENPQHFIELDSEIRTASFLTRDDAGRYGFAHKSYLEYFLAKYLAERLQKIGISALSTKRLTVEILQFLLNMIDVMSIEKELEKTLTNNYVPLISENALIMMYEIRKSRIIANGVIGKDIRDALNSIHLPNGMKLKGARLHQVVLDGAVLDNVDFEDSILSEASLMNASLRSGALSNVNLGKATLKNANCSLANIQSAVLVEANMEGCVLYKTNLQGANLTNCYLLNAEVTEVNLSGAITVGAVYSDNLSHLFDENKTLGTSKAQWDFILSLMPDIERICKSVTSLDDGDTEEIMLETIVRLHAPGVLDKLVAFTKEKMYGYLKNVIFGIISSSAKTSEITFTQLADEVACDHLNGKPASGIDTPYIVDVYSMIEQQAKGAGEGDELTCYDDYDILANNNNIFQSRESPLEVVLLEEVKSLVSDESWRLFESYYINGQTLNDLAKSEKTSIRTVKVRLDKTFEIIRQHLLIRRENGGE